MKRGMERTYIVIDLTNMPKAPKSIECIKSNLITLLASNRLHMLTFLQWPHFNLSKIWANEEAWIGSAF